MKKYIEKRWVGSLDTPVTPLGKIYRPQESQVIEFVSSGQLDCKRKAGEIGIGRQAFQQPTPLELLRRPRGKKGYEIQEKHMDDQIDDIQLSSEEILHRPSKSLTSSRPVGDLQISAGGGNSMTRATESTMAVSCSSRSGYERDITIDDELPESFKYDIITPRVLSSLSSSPARIESSSGTLSTQSGDEVDGIDMEDFMKIVCDVGTQTDRTVLDDAGY